MTEQDAPPLHWVRDGIEDWKAKTTLGTYYCVKNLYNMSVLWLENEKIGTYGGGSHKGAMEAAQLHYAQKMNEANNRAPKDKPHPFSGATL